LNGVRHPATESNALEHRAAPFRNLWPVYKTKAKTQGKNKDKTIF